MRQKKAIKTPRIRWNEYRRQVLCCLYRFFVRDTKQFEEIFSYIFRSHLRERGIQGFISFATLNTQWTWMRNKRHPVWCHVHIDTPFEDRAEWTDIISTIKTTAVTLRIHRLCERTDDTDISLRQSPGVDSGQINAPVSWSLTYLGLRWQTHDRLTE
jgi:hypothetical protein